MHEISVSELKRRLDGGDALTLLDVREHEELTICQLPGAVHIPMGDLPGRVHELDADRELVVFCHHGQRSAAVVAFLERHDFANVANLRGGIERWAVEVDTSMSRY
jgi:rhodanese-related sulfurtransferase